MSKKLQNCEQNIVKLCKYVKFVILSISVVACSDDLSTIYNIKLLKQPFYALN